MGLNRSADEIVQLRRKHVHKCLLYLTKYLQLFSMAPYGLFFFSLSEFLLRLLDSVSVSVYCRDGLDVFIWRVECVRGKFPFIVILLSSIYLPSGDTVNL